MAGVPAVTTFRVSAAFAAVCATAVCLLAAAPQKINPRDALWIIVHDSCVQNQIHDHDPKPCVVVDIHDGLQQGFAVLKDIRGDTQFLLIPTARVTGIESPALLAPGAPNYFADAWEARTYIDDALHRKLPRDAIGLALNSVPSRSQDQLHIHMDCVQPDLHKLLRDHEAGIGKQWAPLDIPFTGHRYLAMWVPGEHLGANNPFRLLVDDIPGAEKNMADRTLVVVGYTQKNGTAGFVIFEDQVDQASHDSAHGEDLLDHSCRVAAAPAAAAPPKN